MTKFLISAAALALTATSAHAQLLGGGLGGALGGGLGGTLSSTIGSTTETVRSTTRGAVDTTAATSGSQSVDRRSGRVEASRSANASANASAGSLLETPLSAVGGSATGSGNVNGQGAASAQLIGTDTVRGLTGQTVGQARGAVDQARTTATSRLGQVRNTAGSLTGNAAGQAAGAANGSSGGMATGSASGNGAASGGLMAMPGQLVAAGSAAANGSGTFAVAPRMPVLDADGDRIGRVRQVVTDNTGRVREVLVQTKDGIAAVPAGNFTANGSALVSAMGEAQLRREAATDEAAAQQSAG